MSKNFDDTRCFECGRETPSTHTNREGNVVYECFICDVTWQVDEFGDPVEEDE